VVLRYGHPRLGQCSGMTPESLDMEGEKIYLDLATLCEQAQIPLDDARAAAAARR